MSSRKRGTAITGDLFIVEHPTMPLASPFTSHVDISFDGITHQVLSVADRSAFSYAVTTGSFAIGDMRGHVIETMDTVATQAVRRFQAVLASSRGVLATQSYADAQHALRLIGELGPVGTPLGMAIDPPGAVEIVGPPRIAITTDVGILEIAPLTASIDAQLPNWHGTPVSHGDLYAGMLSDEVPYLTLVSDTARGVLMLSADVEPDDAAAALADLALTWVS